MSSRGAAVKRVAALAVLAVAWSLAVAPSTAGAAAGFGLLSGPNGCLLAPGKVSDSPTGCGVGKGLVGANAVAVSPDGANVYVASGVFGATQALSFGSVGILKRDAATGAISEVGCLSSDGTDGRDGASGACTPSPSLLGADGVAVSPDGATVFVTSSFSGAVVAFKRDPATGGLGRLGCFQYRPPAGSVCPPANVFSSSAAVVAGANDKAIYIAAPTQGSISTMMASLANSPSSTTGAGSSGSEPTVASLFGLVLPSQFLSNPCVSVNGSDGSCGVGVATQGLDALALSPDGKQVYAVAPVSNSVDVFTPGATGTVTESSCLKVEPPPGLCGASRFLKSPTQLAISPDGRNVYVADHSEGHGRVDVLTRNPSTGALADASCVDNLPPEEKHEARSKEEEEEENKPEPLPPDVCQRVPGLAGVGAVAVSGDGSAVYAIGSDSAVVFSRDSSTGKLAEVSCAAKEDSRCSSFPSMTSVEGAAVSLDGRNVYVATGTGNSIVAFGIGAAVTTARASVTHAGMASVGVQCPRGLHRPCTGQVELTRGVLASATRAGHRRRLTRIKAGRSARFTISPGHRATISVRLAGSSRRILLARRRLRLMAIVRADPLSGGSGFGQPVTLSLGRH
jgi:DNA-binding beta-propeller fold protein YncE